MNVHTAPPYHKWDATEQLLLLRFEVSVVTNTQSYVLVEQWLSTVESNLQEAEVWDNEPPEASDLCSVMPFAADTLRFTQWLQWVFLPRLRVLVANQQTLPKGCCIQPYAEEVLPKELGSVSEAAVVDRLIKMMGEIDRLLS